jgi:hypothetical protein
MTAPKSDAKKKTDPHPWYDVWSQSERHSDECAIRRENGSLSHTQEGQTCNECGAKISGLGWSGLCRSCGRKRALTTTRTRMQAREYAKRVLAGEKLMLRFPQ